MRQVSEQEVLRVDQARKSFRTPESGVVTPLDGITLSIRNNEFLTLLGPSGCGKTTLLKTIAGFEELDEGEIYLEGRAMRSLERLILFQTHRYRRREWVHIVQH